MKEPQTACLDGLGSAIWMRRPATSSRPPHVLRRRRAADVPRVQAAVQQPDVIDDSAPAAFLAELATSVRVGSVMRPPRMSKQDAVRTGELLRQSANRAASQARDDTMTRAVWAPWRQWDDDHRVPQDEGERAQWVQLPPRSRMLAV